MSYPFFCFNKVVYSICTHSSLDTLILTIEEQSAMKENMSVISNVFVFDDKGAASGFVDTMVTSSNKGDQCERFSRLSSKLKVCGKGL